MKRIVQRVDTPHNCFEFRYASLDRKIRLQNAWLYRAERAWAEGPTRQPPPEKGRPDVMSDFIKQGEWGPGFNAQNRMLDEYGERFDLKEQDWRPEKPWYKPTQ